MGSLTITGDGRDIADDGELAGVEVSYHADFKDLAFSLDRVLYHATLSRYISIKGVAMVPGRGELFSHPARFRWRTSQHRPLRWNLAREGVGVFRPPEA